MKTQKKQEHKVIFECPECKCFHLGRCNYDTESYDAGVEEGKAQALADVKITKLKLKEELGKLMQYCKHNQEALDRCCKIIRLCNLQEIK